MFSYLASLVELGIFEAITVNFFIVGHTGNEVDQVKNKMNSKVITNSAYSFIKLQIEFHQ